MTKVDAVPPMSLIPRLLATVSVKVPELTQHGANYSRARFVANVASRSAPEYGERLHWVAGARTGGRKAKVQDTRPAAF